MQNYIGLLLFTNIMKLINSSALSRIIGEKSYYIKNNKNKLPHIGRKKLSGITYYNIEYVKKFICKLKVFTPEEYATIINKLDSYNP
ncbi:hypothetical protein AA637_11845 [Cyanobacterium sp. HL-69]|nr:hypothetical protein AA637_11845 [Cyanobacterium sp. HL-69]